MRFELGSDMIQIMFQKHSFGCSVDIDISDTTVGTSIGRLSQWYGGKAVGQ